MLPWTTLRLGWRCISLGEGPRGVLHGNSKSDAVLDSWFIIIHEQLLQKENNSWAKIGAKWSNYTKTAL